MVNVVQVAHSAGTHACLVEVFTTTQWPLAGEDFTSRQSAGQGNEIHVYELDGIRRIETELSKGLAADPVQSEHIVLQRIQQLDEPIRTRMKSTADGLARIMQYGIDRYPAIVFDGQAVVYGVTDLAVAFAHYQAWRKRGKS
jgi:integrating conjugative element protein (TIGR03757 family)